MAPVGALLLISALDDDLLFSVSLLLLFAACPALSALARRAEVSATVLNSSVGAVFGLATGMRGVAGPTGLAVVGSVFGIAHLAARRWLAPLLSRGTGVMGVMSYVGVQLLVGLAVVHAITAWCLPLAPSSVDGHAHDSFAEGAVLCVATIFCAVATLAALLVAAKALAAGLLACP
ncbi:uncharacterized protein ACA1_191890 [Acanthamoeba castellanii str. Neff]|uniref:Uncharacterized protein n=1 Tax=Acanthamoeba castellanii (strain ATCC 30010 / Neff) TaxID=1257118 RepID=L8GNP8_ACACF|nr:uncharacterized protein ACA1_191890 [Acanthamoeba castellanii str. Neff]ELR14469.1 hypothetical protein ACA1_191890 [Acanthamoeba castellanii str. Neff]